MYSNNLVNNEMIFIMPEGNAHIDLTEKNTFIHDNTTIARKSNKMKISAFIFLIFLTSLTVFGQDFTGQWDGILKVHGIQLRIVFHISKTDNSYISTMDNPDQGAKGIPVTTTSFDHSVLQLAVAIAQIEYKGTLDKDNDIIGTFMQAGQSSHDEFNKRTN